MPSSKSSMISNEEWALRHSPALLHDVGHELELWRVHEAQVHPEARQQQHKALGHADRLRVARRTRPADRRRLAAWIAEALDDRHDVSKGLWGW